jgi:hypothetical protein
MMIGPEAGEVDEETRRRGDEETRRRGDEETRRRGDEETRRRGDEETRHGSGAKREIKDQKSEITQLARGRA